MNFHDPSAQHFSRNKRNMTYECIAELDGQGKARREAARRRNPECKINLSCRNSSRGNGSRPTAQRWAGPYVQSAKFWHEKCDFFQSRM